MAPGNLTHAVAYTSLYCALVAFRFQAEALGDAMTDLATALIIAESYDWEVMADFERDSGGTVEEIERVEAALGVE